MDIKDIVNFLGNYDGRELSFMEVCGTHTAAVRENGIPSLLSDRIRLVSGPGCPVCVTAASYADRLCELALRENTCVVTFGDMIRVPGSRCALRDVTSVGGDVRVVYSPLDIIELAEADRQKEFIFAAVGFETTAPVYAALLDRLTAQGIDNVKLLTALKTMPPAIDVLCRGENRPDGFIAPGHVSVITGSDAFVPLAKKYNLPFVVSGFGGEELLCAIYALVKLSGRGTVLNLYKSAVSDKGNEKAQQLVNKYFSPCDAYWRGLGVIEGSGLALRGEYSRYDAGGDMLFEDSIAPGCRCAQVITGEETPLKCSRFGRDCTPEKPVGACMVSAEGACFNYFINK